MKKTLALLAALAFAAPSAFAFDQKHEAWDAIVSKRVKGDRFDYKGLKPEKDKVEAYLKTLSEVSRAEFKSWDEAGRLAFLINLYNAATVDLILDHYPVKSIKDIAGGKPWDQPVVALFGDKVTLNHLENGIIRKDFGEPRIHFAVNCASVGCPSLRNEAYLGPKLDGQLEAQTKEFMKDSKHNRVKGGDVVLSPLFDWYREDFVKKSGSVGKFVAVYLPEAGGKKVSFGDYDWSLNGK